MPTAERHELLVTRAEVENPARGMGCFAGRCTEPATRQADGAVYCERHGGRGLPELAPTVELVSVVMDGYVADGQTLGEALVALARQMAGAN
jgi:hypothetical protein